MIEIFITKEFQKRYKDLPQDIKKKARKQEKLFRNNPFYPSLHTEKLIPKEKDIWSFRIDKKYRIIFHFKSKDEVIFMTVGDHDWVYKIKF
tara:strand:+ start:2134 stop:2406 length:273 start_codon:yes stop_codon:yes gene_type:complete